MKNVILLMTDTFRYDNLGNRAVMPVNTPELDRFAAERATSIERFYMGSGPTIPQRTDLASGVLGWPHYGWQPIDESGPNHIAEMLSNQGYATQLICDCPHLFRARIHEKFDAALHIRNQEQDTDLLHLNDAIDSFVPIEKTRQYPRYKGRPLPDHYKWVNHLKKSEWDMFPRLTGETVIRWLENNYKAKPFFLWADFFDPHEPWDAPDYMVKHYDPDYDGVRMIHPNYGPASDYTQRELINMKANYNAEAELVDRWLGCVIQKIEDLELWENTILVVLSDHGISIGEHDRTGKTNLHPTDLRYWPYYPEVSHAICLFAGGDVPKGQSLDIIAQPIDLLPTICDLAGAKVDMPKPVEGRSFSKAILSGDNKHRDFSVSGWFVPSRGTKGTAKSAMSFAFTKEQMPTTSTRTDKVPTKITTPFLTVDNWGYAPVGPDGEPELYDLIEDPLAVNNLAQDKTHLLNEFFDLLISHLNEHNAPGPFIEIWKKLKKH